MLSSVLLLRLWQAGAGLLTALLVVRYLSPELQGWYYSFLSIAALYTLFDLGLSTVLVQVSVHETVGIRWNRDFSCTGNRAAVFAALLGSAVRWYLLLAVIFAVFVLPGGYLLFSHRTNDIASWHWHWPWLLLCIATAGSLAVMPFFSILEGAGQIGLVYRVRLIQAILGSFACWAMLASGANLWACAMMSLLALLTSVAWLLVRGRTLLKTAWVHRYSAYGWRYKVWPLQWRMAVGWFSGYLVTQINIPILFHIEGAALAGQFGLSLAVVNTVGLVCQSWFTRHVPLMAHAVIERNWKRFDDVFFKDFMQSVALFTLSALVLIAGLLLYKQAQFINRLLPFWPFVGLLGYAFVSLVVSAWATHLRSFRREPLLPIIFFCNLLVVPGVVAATKWFSINGMVVVLDIVYLLILLPISWLIWRRCNRVWREVA